MSTCDEGRPTAGGRKGKGWPFRSMLVAGLVGIAVGGATASAQVGRFDGAAGERQSPARAAAAGRDPRNVPPRDKPAGAEPDALAAPSYAVVSNETLRLGINPQGHLDVSLDDGSELGLEYLPTGADALINGCWCEGWGVADTDAGVSGWASVYNGGISRNVTVSSFDATADTAESVVEVGGRLRVMHLYRPSSRPELYQVDLRVDNIGSSTARVVYRRAMDWDVPPTEFDELVTIQGSHPALLDATDDGFTLVDPLQPLTDLGARGMFKDIGPDDRGSAFDLSLGTLAPGASATLTMFYGAAATEADALAALDAVDADLYSLGQPNTPDGPTLGTPNTFMFGITDGSVATGPVIVQGRLIVPTGGNPPDGDPSAISGSVGLYLATGGDDARSEDLLIASGTTEPDGTFVLRSNYTSPLSGAAAINDGQINLDLVANANGFVYHESVIRAFAAGAWVSEDGVAPPDVAANPLSAGVNPRLVPGSAGGATTGSTAFAGCVRYRFPLDSQRAWTTVGELHTPADTDVASFKYGERADSFISKAVSLNGTAWVLKGMVKVGSDATTETTTEVGVMTGADRWAKEMRTEFVYTRARIELWCGAPIASKAAEEYEIKATEWVGSFREGADLTHLDNRCLDDHAAYLVEFGRNGLLNRSDNRYGTFVRAASLTVGGATISLNARSGMSRWVRVSWDFGVKSDRHVLCGTDAFPPKASRIFAGA